MPLPTPNDREEKDSFISRCMGSEVTNKDFPDSGQRFAVCNSQWDRSKKKALVDDLATVLTQKPE
jgi:hypothetical protein